MSTDAAAPNLADAIGKQLPFLRRYARALTGKQSVGDAYAAAALEAILADESIFDSDLHPKEALFKVFHVIWHSGGAPSDEAETGAEAAVHKHLSNLTANSREVLLMSVIEGFSANEIAHVVSSTKEEVEDLLQVAYKEMEHSLTGKIMIIEDEAIIAMDLEGIVTDLGHQVTGVARTQAGAVTLARQAKPDLILADIQLADNTSGIDAVKDILRELGDTPVIFITAFPERLLTGERPEPTFLISKPYTENQVRVAVSQAMFFSSTEPLQV